MNKTVVYSFCAFLNKNSNEILKILKKIIEHKHDFMTLLKTQNTTNCQFFVHGTVFEDLYLRKLIV
jgi:hypothetical protein